ncbi:MAG: Chemotaxis protein methyltransferase CheR, partial [Sphingomonadales bacterium]|nr:Chemotaxis protein methyltransferase CheR [Sphingomonadales bacterium]
SEPVICYRRHNEASFWASLFISDVCDDEGNVVQHFVSFVDETEQRAKQSHCEMLIDELNHRVKNTLSTVQSITRQALRNATDPASIGKSIDSRIFALARSHDLLTHHNWEGATVRDVINAALKPFGAANGHAERFTIKGENLRLLPKTTLALGIAFHELATNAVKYGAFSNDRGRIAISWLVTLQGAKKRLILTWQESHGPAVKPPSHKGFGSQILERGLAHELRGEVQLDYRVEGLVATIDIPVSERPADD